MAKAYSNNEEIDDTSYDNTHNTSCDGCQSAKIYSDRYRCLQCVDYDLCGNCFEDRRQTKQHSSGHAMVHFKIPNELFGQPVFHSNNITLTKINKLLAGQQHGIECDGCRTLIVGVRFNCDTCHNYNLCSNCMRQRVISKNHQNTHPLVATSNQSLAKIEISDIRKGDVLGQGAFGQVFKARWLSKTRQVACKVIIVTPHRRHLEDSFRKELAAYAELSGAYILKTFGYCEHLMANGIKECYLITEFMHRGSLANVIHDRNEKISLRRKLSMICQVVSGMHKLHAHSMIHRDIRPDNILVSSNYTAKIGDMGIARVFNSNEQHTLMGCLPFMPPEFHRGDGQYDQSLDVFTFGLTLNELLTEKPHQFIQSTKRVKLTEQSPIFVGLVAQCINDEPIQRPTAAELADILNKYRRAADKYIKEKYPNYTSQTLIAKDNIFVKFYNEYHKVEKAEPKLVYSPPPRPRLSSDLIHQHFDDMMKQFDNFHQMGFHRQNDQQRSSRFVKWAKYFDEGRIDDRDLFFRPDAMKINKPPSRSFTPPSNFLRVQEESHQQFLNVVKNQRSRTPTPLSPRFGEHMADRFRPIGADNDFEQNLMKFHFDANFDQSSSQFHRMMQKFK